MLWVRLITRDNLVATGEVVLELCDDRKKRHLVNYRQVKTSLELKKF